MSKLINMILLELYERKSYEHVDSKISWSEYLIEQSPLNRKVVKLISKYSTERKLIETLHNKWYNISINMSLLSQHEIEYNKHVDFKT